MFKWLQGKKTYAIVAATFVLGGLSACGVGIPAWVYAILAGLGLGGLRAGVGKLAP